MDFDAESYFSQLSYLEMKITVTQQVVRISNCTTVNITEKYKYNTMTVNTTEKYKLTGHQLDNQISWCLIFLLR